MARHRNIRKMRYEDELSNDEYGLSYDDLKYYAVSPDTEEMFTYNREATKEHTLSSFIEEPSINEQEQFPSDEENDNDQNADFKMPELDDADQAKLQLGLESLEGILGENCHQPTAVDALMKFNYDIEKALDDILSKGGRQTLSLETKSSSKSKVVDNFNGISDKITIQDTQIGGFTFNYEPSVFHTTPYQSSDSRDKYKKSFSVPTSPKSRRKLNSTDSALQTKADSADRKSKRDSEPYSDSEDRRSAPSSVTTTPVASRRSLAKTKDPLNIEEEYKKRQDGKDLLNLIVIGHVDAGKSTLMGHLLYRLGNVTKRAMHKNETESKKAGKGSFAYAWVLDETEEERTRGITMDVAMTTFETSTKSITLMDAPGHRDFIPNMIQGTSQADVAILVVDASVGEFESGFEQGGQTREHALLARSLGVNQVIVAVNKMDNVGWASDRYDDIVAKMKSFLKQAGFKESDVKYIPCSGMTGENLIEKATAPDLISWYKGECLTDQIDKFKPPQRPIDKPFRLCVSDVYKGQSGAFLVAGKVEAGHVQNGDRVLLMPAGEQGSIKALTHRETSVKWAAAGDHVTMTVTGVDVAHVSVGSVLCDTISPIKASSRFTARIVVFNVEMPIIKGFIVVLHCQSLSETATITKLVSLLNKNTGEVTQKRPRFLSKHANAVIQMQTARPVCIELFKDNRVLGRIMLRYGGKTIAAGVITEIR